MGKGSFGKVLQVRKIDAGEIYAMKVLKKENVVKRNQVRSYQRRGEDDDGDILISLSARFSSVLP